MKLKHNYWFFKNAISPRLCDEIIQYGLRNKKEQGITEDQGKGKGRDLLKNPLSVKEIKQLKKNRDSQVVWLYERWICNMIQPFVHTANRNAGWNFEWDWSEPSQFTIYTKGQYYGWHQDNWHEALQGKIRKLSMTVSLSDQKEYSGGNLEFDFRAISKNKPWVCKEINSKGSVVVFPSFVWHRVTPVTRGTRYSLVSWHSGAPFK